MKIIYMRTCKRSEGTSEKREKLQIQDRREMVNGQRLTGSSVTEQRARDKTWTEKRNTFFVRELKQEGCS